jgi:hypothetical protein
MTKLKNSQKLRIVRYFGNNQSMAVYTTVNRLGETVDLCTTTAVREALDTIANDRFQYKGISATFNGIEIQVNLID